MFKLKNGIISVYIVHLAHIAFSCIPMLYKTTISQFIKVPLRALTNRQTSFRIHTNSHKSFLIKCYIYNTSNAYYGVK